MQFGKINLKCQIQKLQEFPIEFAGKNSEEKIAEIIDDLEADAVLITDPISVNWLFNIRGSDLAYTPIKFAYAIIYKNGERRIIRIPESYKFCLN